MVFFVDFEGNESVLAFGGLDSGDLLSSDWSDVHGAMLVGESVSWNLKIKKMTDLGIAGWGCLHMVVNCLVALSKTLRDWLRNWLRNRLFRLRRRNRWVKYCGWYDTHCFVHLLGLVEVFKSLLKTREFGVFGEKFEKFKKNRNFRQFLFGCFPRYVMFDANSDSKYWGETRGSELPWCMTF